jgi:hypothetical protein
MRDHFKEYAETFLRNNTRISAARSECSDMMISPDTVRSRAHS